MNSAGGMRERPLPVVQPPIVIGTVDPVVQPPHQPVGVVLGIGVQRAVVVAHEGGRVRLQIPVRIPRPPQVGVAATSTPFSSTLIDRGSTRLSKKTVRWSIRPSPF